MVVRRRGWLVAGGVFLAGVVTASVAWFWPEPKPVALVRDYFEAIGERKVEEALRVAGVQRPRGERGRFLVPEAIDGGLEIAKITVESEDSEYADMTVVVESRDGVPFPRRVRVLKEKDGLRLADPFAVVVFEKTALRYAEVGGVRIPFVAEDENGDGYEDNSVTYDLFPGDYRFYAGRSDIVRTRVEQSWLWGGARVEPQFTITPVGQQAVARAYKSFIDQCVRKGGVRPQGCPFGRDISSSFTWRSYPFPEFRQTSWRVLKYPTVVAAPGTEALELNEREPGIVELTGVGKVNSAKPSRRFSAQCEINTGDVEVVVGMDQRISIRDTSGYPLNTCRKAPAPVR
ncbi:hypothetical protein [Actinomadura sp. HBU206391]|uniref:hypothetical protein n=1 Tax=Actinomadura sp. HBU206391 TaxID=2731692 RepID=UPI00164F0EB2|nr:hypothetical protein [Actinomadura sp. HBU206391]MBC6458747.1 hypothetical protein [Actinomadura sp. HBU206391]